MEKKLPPKEHTLEIKLQEGKRLIPRSYDSLPEKSEQVYVEFSINNESMQSTAQPYNHLIKWNEMFLLKFNPKHKQLQVSVFIQKKSAMVTKRPILVSSFKLVILGREARLQFIKGIPISLPEYQLNGSKDKGGTLSLWLTARNFGLDINNPDDFGRNFKHAPPGLISQSGGDSGSSKGVKKSLSIGNVSKWIKGLKKGVKGKDKKKKASHLFNNPSQNEGENQEFIKMYASSKFLTPGGPEESQTKKKIEEVEVDQGMEEPDENEEMEPKTPKKLPKKKRVGNLSLETSDDFSNIPRVQIGTQELLVGIEDVHDTSCFLGDSTLVGYYTGKVKKFDTLEGGSLLVPEGKGKMRFKAAVFEGVYSKGKKCEKGSVSIPGDKVTIDCEWQFDTPHGEVHIEYGTKQRSYYTGTIHYKGTPKTAMDMTLKTFERSGYGLFVSGEKQYMYYGTFVDDKRDGSGICDFKDGDRYIGCWKNDVFHGMGCFVSVDGSVYYGEFERGKRVNSGNYYLSNGIRLTGEWDVKENLLQMVEVKEGSYDFINEDIVQMITSELKKAQMSEKKKAEGHLKRSYHLWSSLFKKNELELQIRVMHEEVPNFWFAFNPNICYQMLEDDGYVNRFCRLFHNYFNSFFSSENTYFVEKKKLLYAREDIRTFITFLSKEFFLCLQEFSPRVLSSKVVAEEQVSANKKESEIEASKGSFQETSKEITEEVSRNQKNVIADCLNDYIHRKIYDILKRLYEVEYREEEILFQQKLTSILHALQVLPIKEKRKHLLRELESIETSGKSSLEEYHMKEVEAMKLLMLSCENSRMSLLQEENFLKLQMKAIGLKFKQARVCAKRNEKIFLETLKCFFDIFNNLSLEEDLFMNKEFLVHVENQLKLTRIGLTSNFKIKELGLIKDVLDIVSENSTCFDDSQVCSFDYQIDSLLCCFKSILNIITKDKFFFNEIKSMESLTRSFESLSICLNLSHLPSYLQMNQMKKSVQKRVQSLISVMSNMKLGSVKQIIELLGNVNVGNLSAIKQKAAKISTLIVEADVQKFIHERWDSIHSMMNKGFQFEKVEELYEDILLQIMSIKSEILLTYGVERDFEQVELMSQSENEDDNDEMRRKLEESERRILEFERSIAAFEGNKKSSPSRTSPRNKPLPDVKKKKRRRAQKVLNETERKLVPPTVETVVMLLSSIELDIVYMTTVKEMDMTVSESFHSNLRQRMKCMDEFLLLHTKGELQGGNNLNVIFKYLNTAKKLFQHFLSNCKTFFLHEEAKKLREEFQKRIKTVSFSSDDNLSVAAVLRRGENFFQRNVEESDDDQFFEEKIRIIKSVENLEFGVKAIQISMETREIEKKLSELSLSVAETGGVISESRKELKKLTNNKKINTVMSCMKSFEERGWKRKGTIRLESFGVSPKFVPEDYMEKQIIPYKKSIAILSELKIQLSLGDKWEVIRSFEKSLHHEMQEVSKKKKERFEEDDVLPLTLYCLLMSNLNHSAQFHYLSDWKSSSSLGFLTRYDVFFKYIQNLDPYLRKEGGELLNVIGNICTPIKRNIWKITSKKEKFSISWLINLFNYIYCEIGFLTGNERFLEIKDEKLKDSINENIEILETVLVENVGFTISTDADFESKLVIEFQQVYKPNIYKFISQEVLRDFSEYCTFSSIL